MWYVDMETQLLVFAKYQSECVKNGWLLVCECSFSVGTVFKKDVGVSISGVYLCLVVLDSVSAGGV